MLENSVIQTCARNVSLSLFSLLSPLSHFRKDILFIWLLHLNTELRLKTNKIETNTNKKETHTHTQRQWKRLRKKVLVIQFALFCDNPGMNGATASPTSPLLIGEVAVMATAMMLCFSAWVKSCSYLLQCLVHNGGYHRSRVKQFTDMLPFLLFRKVARLQAIKGCWAIKQQGIHFWVMQLDIALCHRPEN